MGEHLHHLATCWDVPPVSLARTGSHSAYRTRSGSSTKSARSYSRKKWNLRVVPCTQQARTGRNENRTLHHPVILAPILVATIPTLAATLHHDEECPWAHQEEWGCKGRIQRQQPCHPQVGGLEHSGYVIDHVKPLDAAEPMPGDMQWQTLPMQAKDKTERSCR